MTPKLTAALSCAVLVAGTATAVTAGAATAAHARAETCQGRTPTIVGPTQGENTTGTEGDDVIVAPINGESKVSGLGGNDTICLVAGVVPSSRTESMLRIEGVVIDAGAGNDSVTNELTAPHNPSVSLGPGSDHYVGNDLYEDVAGSALGQPDTDIDVIDTRGGDDSITTGSPSGTDENHDVISTGAGRDLINYGGLAGGALDNGDGADALTISSPWSGELAFDNTTRRATLAGNPGLSWTSIIVVIARVRPGSSFGFVGSDAAEGVYISGTSEDLASDSTIATGRGFDSVRLENYLPGSVDLGEGRGDLHLEACVRSYVDLGGEAACFTAHSELVVTKLAGIDQFWGKSAEVMNVRGPRVTSASSPAPGASWSAASEARTTCSRRDARSR